MQQEQRELLQALYREHVETIRFVALSKGLPPEEIDDVIQDTFCNFIDAYEREFAQWNEKQIKSALMRILYNRCADYYREKQRHPDTSIENCAQEDEYRIVMEMIAPDVEEQVEKKEYLLRLRECICRMTPAIRDVAVLCLIEERPVEEASRILRISAATCRMRLCRARRHLLEMAAV